MARTFQEKLRDAQDRSDSALCVGLDPRSDRLPSACRRAAEPFLAFCRQVVDATADLVCAFKPQYACFAATGAFDELRTLIAYIHENHPDVPVILDAKRGDIGDVSALYAKEVFEVLDADAATVNPYLGWDAVEPFARVPERGAIVLCHTSNPGSPWLQEFPEAAPLYLRVAERVAKEDAGNLALVVGSRNNSPPFAPRRLLCRSWCQASVPRAATSKPCSPTASQRMAPDWSLAPRAA